MRWPSGASAHHGFVGAEEGVDDAVAFVVRARRVEGGAEGGRAPGAQGGDVIAGEPLRVAVAGELGGEGARDDAAFAMLQDEARLANRIAGVVQRRAELLHRPVVLRQGHGPVFVRRDPAFGRHAPPDQGEGVEHVDAAGGAEIAGPPRRFRR